MSWWIAYWICFGLSVFSLFPLLFFIRESPKFYISVGKFSEAREVYRYIAKLNSKPMFSERLEGESSPSRLEGNSSRGVRELVGMRELRPTLVVLLLDWFVVSFVSYGMAFSLGELDGSIYLNGYFYGATAAASYFIVWPVTECLGRRKATILSYLIGGLPCLLYSLLKKIDIALAYTCVGFGSFGTSCAFNLVYLVTAEAFPTEYRGAVFGLGSLMARLGGILAPLVSSIANGTFMYIFGGLSVGCGMASLLLKETQGLVMSDNVGQQTQKKAEAMQLEYKIVLTGRSFNRREELQFD